MSTFLAFAKVALTAFKFVVDSWLATVGVIIHGAAIAFGWVPGVGAKLKQADKWFGDFRTSVDAKFNGLQGTMSRWQKSLTDSMDTAKQFRLAAAPVTAAFDAQAQKARVAAADVNGYTTAIRNNGIGSAAAQGARRGLVNDMINAGVKAGTARTDVNNYTTAVRNNGLNSDAAQAARRRLVNDIGDAFRNSRQGRTDMSAYTTAVRNNGSASDAAKSARAKLITDLRSAGLTGDEARRLVANLTTAIRNIPTKHNTNVTVHGSGSGGITSKATGIFKQAGSVLLLPGGARVEGARLWRW